jgi:hypothetical protein
MRQRGFIKQQIKALGTKGYRGVRLKQPLSFHEQGPR